MLQFNTYGEVVYQPGLPGDAEVRNESGDFAVMADPGTQLFEIKFRRDVSQCIVQATAKDPHLRHEPYITVAVERPPNRPNVLLVGTLNEHMGPVLKPRLIEKFGFWFMVSDPVESSPQRKP